MQLLDRSHYVYGQYSESVIRDVQYISYEESRRLFMGHLTVGETTVIGPFYASSRFSAFQQPELRPVSRLYKGGVSWKWST